MALRSRPYILLLSHLYKAIIVSATTTVYFYTDASCKTPYATVHADTDAGNGPCGEFTTSVKSACSGWIDNGCSVTAYAGSNHSFCSDSATNVPLGSCTSLSIGSFSVDCPQINGSYNPEYSTILASDMSSRTSLPSNTSTSTYSVSVSSKPSSEQSPKTGIPSPNVFSSTTSSLPETPASSLQDSHLSTSSTSQPSLSSSPSPTSQGSGNGGGLSGPSTIAIGVVLPGVAVIVAIIFGVLGFKKWQK